MSFNPFTLLVIFALVVAGAYGVHYTQEVDHSSRELRQLQGQLQGIVQLNETKQRISEAGEVLGTELGGLQAQATELQARWDALLLQQKDLESTHTVLCDSLPPLVEKVRAAASGEELGTFTTTDGKSYAAARITSVTDDELSVFHDAGSSRFSISVVPPELVKRFRMGKPLPSKSDITSFLAIPGADVKVKAKKQTSVRTDDDNFNPDLVVFIETDQGHGSGFIAEEGGVPYVYTNAHVICGSPGGFVSKITRVRTASSKTLNLPHDVQISDTFDPLAPNGLEDVARFRVNLPEGVKAYQLADKSTAPTLRMSVVAYGNSEGSGVMTTLPGEVLGLGVDRFEISSGIVPGNSGGPVVDSKTGEVIGISTYLDTGTRDIWTTGTRFGSLRRFAVRPQKVTKWRTMRYTSLQMALKQLSDFDRDTLNLAAACFLNPRPNRGGFDAPSTQRGNYIIREVITTGSQLRLGRVISGGIAKVNQKLGGTTSTYSVAGVVPVFQDFFGEVAHASASQTNELAMADRAPYLKAFVADMVKLRRLIEEEFKQQGATRYR